ncbi:hypothetical protein [Halobacillus litoralis]|uniref:hypothetical protein n=1 Tax=Halobacillus litoralis TaxID=45668 RepID=UPI001CFD0C8F|nr:hypothetical protein [Halobacillus litoralis]
MIENNQQQYLENEENLYLYERKVVAPEETLLLKDIHDLSYKELSGSYGFLYIHTIKGVRAYMVREHPGAWMKAVLACI